MNQKKSAEGGRRSKNPPLWSPACGRLPHPGRARLRRALTSPHDGQTGQRARWQRTGCRNMSCLRPAARLLGGCGRGQRDVTARRSLAPPGWKARGGGAGLARANESGGRSPHSTTRVRERRRLRTRSAPECARLRALCGGRRACLTPRTVAGRSAEFRDDKKSRAGRGLCLCQFGSEADQRMACAL